MTDLIHRRAAASKAFRAIGHNNGHAPPESDGNTHHIAYEFLIADHLRSLANARYEAAKEAAQAAGVIETDYSEGTHIPYARNGLSVIATRAKDSLTLDKTMLKNELMKSHGFDETKVNKLLVKSSKPRKGATTHKFSMEDE